MLVTEVVTATFALLVASAWGQEPEPLGGSSPSSAIDGRSEVFNPGPGFGIQVELSGVGDNENKRNDIFGKALDSEENADEYDDGDEYDDDDEDDYDYYNEYDLSEEDQDDNKDESKERFKRKIIFRGGGGGGIYSRSGRRGQAGYGEEDPYGRRRDHYGGRGPADSWPYRRQDNPYPEPSQNTPSTTRSTIRGESAPVYGTTRRIADEGSSRSKSSSSASSNSSGKRTKTERRETTKVKISKELKTEIAQYAVQHGAQRAAEHFQDRIGKKLRVKKIEKFVKRYQSKQ